MRNTHYNCTWKVFVLWAVLQTAGLYCLAQNPPCNNSTFSIRIPALTGEKIKIIKLQTFPDGNYMLAGMAITAAGSADGLLMVLSNDGNIILQRRLQIDNKATLITDAKMLTSGQFAISGYYADGTTEAFLTLVDENLLSVWSKSVTESEVPKKVTVDIFNTNNIAFAAQLSNSINYSVYNGDGTLAWTQLLKTNSLTDLIGFTSSTASYNTLIISTNCTYLGNPAIEVFDVLAKDGSLAYDNIQGKTQTYNIGMAVNCFNDRVNLTGISRSASAKFSLFRNNISRGAITETSHAYQLPIMPDSAATGAMDNSGDGFGFFSAASRELLFIKHFSSSQSSPEFAKKYTVPDASSLASITRSYDGGFLFGLNSSLSNEIILLKTDSLGTLPVCGSEDIAVSASETNSVLNTSASSTFKNISYTEKGALYTYHPSALNTIIDCKQNYCPIPFPTNNCLNTYFKTLRSASYADVVDKYFLLKDNKQLLFTAAINRVVGERNQFTYNLKLLDERGNMLRSINAIRDSLNSPPDIYQLDDRKTLLVFNVSSVSTQTFNCILLDEQLHVIWSKNILTQGDFNSQGLGVSDAHEDAEGNIFLVSTQLGFTDKPKVFIYKMDKDGTGVWTRAFEMTAGSFYQANLASTATSLIVVINGSDIISIRLDKKTGRDINNYSFTGNWDGSTNQRYMKYENGNVFYAGSDKNAQFLMGIFDSTGKPLLMRHLNIPFSKFVAAALREGNLYAIYNTASGTDTKEVLFKADSKLNIEFIKAYPLQNELQSRGIGVSDGGYIYTGGNISYGNGNYSDPYLRKFDPSGELGSCTFSVISPVLTNEVPNASSILLDSLPRTYVNHDEPFTLKDNKSVLNINQVLCSSNSILNCSFIKLKDSGPACSLNSDYLIHFTKDINCTVVPDWLYDTSYAVLNKITDTGAIFTFKKTGDVLIVGRLITGCASYRDSLIIHVEPSPSSLNLGGNGYFCLNDSLVLHAGVGYDKYVWQDGSSDSVFMVKQSGKYFVTVSNSCGESKTDTAVMTKRDCMVTVYLPNIFTPNGDGRNDVFKPIVYAPLVEYSLSVFNRLGERVYYSKDFNDGWDGKYKGAQCPLGNYVWVCDFMFAAGKKEEKKGVVLLGR